MVTKTEASATVEQEEQLQHDATPEGDKTSEATVEDAPEPNATTPEDTDSEDGDGEDAKPDSELDPEQLQNRVDGLRRELTRIGEEGKAKDGRLEALSAGIKLLEKHVTESMTPEEKGQFETEKADSEATQAANQGNVQWFANQSTELHRAVTSMIGAGAMETDATLEAAFMVGGEKGLIEALGRLKELQPELDWLDKEAGWPEGMRRLYASISGVTTDAKIAAAVSNSGADQSQAIEKKDTRIEELEEENRKLKGVSNLKGGTGATNLDEVIARHPSDPLGLLRDPDYQRLTSD